MPAVLAGTKIRCARKFSACMVGLHYLKTKKNLMKKPIDKLTWRAVKSMGFIVHRRQLFIMCVRFQLPSLEYFMVTR